MAGHRKHLAPDTVIQAAEYMLLPISELCPACAMSILSTMLATYTFHGIIPEQCEEFLNDIVKHARDMLAGMERFDKDTTIQ